MARGAAGGTPGEHPRRPRALLLTPDYPPDRGGIQLLSARLVASFSSFDAAVVTLTPATGTSGSECGVRRVRRRGVSRVSILALNATAVGLALRRPPDVVVSMHITCAPAVALLRSVLGVPAVQYLYSKEVAHNPLLARAAMVAAHRTICVSAHTRELALRAGARADRVVVVHPGVDVPSLPPPEKEGRPTIITVARLADRYKGHDVILQALVRLRRSLPDVQWIVIGDGPLRGELERSARAAGIGDAVRFLGVLDDSDRDRWLARSHVFAMPSRVPDDLGGEGFGIVYLEAGALGVPVVAGRAGGAVDAVRDGETGLLVDAADPEAVGAALMRLLSDAELARAHGRLGSPQRGAQQLARRRKGARDGAPGARGVAPRRPRGSG